MIPARLAPIVFGFILSGFMTLIVSLVAVIRAVGFADNLFTLWITAWLPAWLVAFPVIVVVAPIVRKFVARHTAPAKSPEGA